MSNSIAEAFKKLNVSPSAEPSDHEQIYTVSYEYLSRVKNFNDLRSFKSCLVALINLDKYFKAFEVIKKVNQTNSELINDSILEVAYIYYKLGKSDALLELYANQKNKIDNEGIQLGLNHILAQNYYKIGEYQNALQLYHELLEANKYDSQSDLIINERAVISQLNFNSNKQLKSKFDTIESNYDLYFNEALIELSNNNLSESLKYLEQSQQLCQDQNSQWSSSDLLIELLPIKLTIAFIYQLQGDDQQSLSILHEYNNFDSSINDAIIKLTIRNNLYALSNDEIKNAHIIDSEINYQKNLQQLNSKLTKFQYQILHKNNLLLRYLSGTLSTSQLNSKFINQYIKDYPGDYLPLAYKILLDLEISIKDLNDATKWKAIGKKLFRYIKSQTVQDLSNELKLAILLLVFVNDKSSNFDQSLLILEEVINLELEKEQVLTPALHGVLIQILENSAKNNNQKKLVDYLNQLITKFLNTEPKLIEQDLNYFNFIKLISFKSLNYPILQENSIQLFKSLNEIIKNDKLISSILLNSTDSLLSTQELIASGQSSTNSTSIEDLLQVNIEELLPSSTSSVPKPTSATTKSRKINENKVVKKKKAAKFGPTKVVKPEGQFTIDDERWLPMKLRSYYKPSKKDKKKGSHQGVVESPTASAASTPAPTSASTTTTNTSSSSKNKKKKKGKK
ncbi:hypothetical protein DFJ63DRAFT_321971 [Scheffersomyces coipomensis]|uniref:uncharacterized protein n=1 Tax=Scheffersomyces coipomensis TaxID=1788519 RepID=UPI00315CF6AD